MLNQLEPWPSCSFSCIWYWAWVMILFLCVTLSTVLKWVLFVCFILLTLEFLDVQLSLGYKPRGPCWVNCKANSAFPGTKIHWLGLGSSLGGESSLRLFSVPKDRGFSTTENHVTVNLGCHYAQNGFLYLWSNPLGAPQYTFYTCTPEQLWWCCQVLCLLETEHFPLRLF